MLVFLLNENHYPFLFLFLSTNTMDCSICFEPFNLSTRKSSTCPSCAVKMCRTCIQTYLLQDDGQDPKCASCKAPWLHTFLYSTLTSTFRLGPYKLHREKVLYDREKARLPDTQEDAQRYKNAKELIVPIKTEINRLRQEMAAVPKIAAYTKLNRELTEEHKKYNKKTIEERRAWWWSDEKNTMVLNLEKLRKQIKPLQKPFLDSLSALADTLITPNHIVTYYGLLPRGETTPIKERRTFIMKCPQETCEGFLSNHYKCGMCETQICHACHITLEKTTDSHLCDPDLVETIKQIKKEARPCPKCTSLISKIDGCDQMWCTQCNTAFSWNTGKIETQVIHNPHYFAWMRTTGQTIPPMGDGPAHACVEINTISQTLTVLDRDAYKKASMRCCPSQAFLDAAVAEVSKILFKLNEYHRSALHIQNVTIVTYRRELRILTDEEPKRFLRVRRLTNELTDDDWKFTLQKKEKAIYKIQDWIQLLEMYATSTLETLARLKTDSTREDIHTIEKQLDALREYVDTEAAKTSKLYGCVLPDALRLRPKPNTA